MGASVPPLLYYNKPGLGHLLITCIFHGKKSGYLAFVTGCPVRLPFLALRTWNPVWAACPYTAVGPDACRCDSFSFPGLALHLVGT